MDRMIFRVALVSGVCGVLAASSATAQSRARPPIEYFHLTNGLRVVLSPDTTMPVVVSGVYYGIGHRGEPPASLGFAHLFEHLMFEGSTHLATGELIRLIQANGGTFNGSTRFDFTNFYEIVPSSSLRLMLWAESDRMRGLIVDSAALRRQKDIVKTELYTAYFNRPYGGFPWKDVPTVGNLNWQNAHDFRGTPADIEAATLEQVQAFFRQYYVPNNAALVVSGNFRSADARAWVKSYFEPIPASPSITRPDATEQPQTAERRGGRVDSLAPRPALAVAWHMPERWTRAWFSMLLIDQILIQGSDSWMQQELVRRRHLVNDVSGGANLQGNSYNYKGAMLWAVTAFYDDPSATDTLVNAVQGVVSRLQTGGVSAADLVVARSKALSALYDIEDYYGGFGRADLLASFALFDDDPTRIDRLEAELGAVTAADIQRTAREFLNVAQRTVYTISAPRASRGRPGGDR
jgi:zinc protease